MKVIVTAVLESFSTRVDKSYKIVLGTQELPPETATKLFELHQKPIKVLLSDSKITPIAEELLDDLDIGVAKPGKKSQSNRLRNVIFLMHKQSGSDVDFDDYYDSIMERIIEFYKEKLN